MVNIRNKLKCSVSKEDVTKRLPIIGWLPQYNLQKLRGDIIAGLTVGIMVVPQSLAFASFAGLNPHYGLYSAFAPGILYLFLGSAKDMNVGPTVISSLLTARYNSGGTAQGAAALAFMTGLILLALGLLRLGSLVRFIPTSVVSGFVSAAAVTIAVGQLKGIFGHIVTKADPIHHPVFFGKLYHFFKSIGHTNPMDVGIGLICLAFLISLQIIGKKIEKKTDAGRCTRGCFLIIRSIVVAKSALICILATVVSFALYKTGHRSVTLPGDIPSGMPTVSFPFSSSDSLPTPTTNATFGNATMTPATTGGDDPLELLKMMGSGLIIVPMILFIEDVSIAKALGRKNLYTVDATQELYALGIGNVFGSIFGGYPVTGSFSRSAVNSMSGAQTTISSFITSCVVLLSLAFLTPVFWYIPMAALHAMVFAAVINMIDIAAPRRIWKTNRIDIVPFVFAFLGTFYELEAGVLGGSAIALLIMLYRQVRPRTTIVRPGIHEATVKVRGGLWYPATDSLVDSFNELIRENDALRTIELDFGSVFECDYTVVYGLESAHKDLKTQNVDLKFVKVNEEHVRGVIIRGGLGDLIESDVKYDTHTRRASDVLARRTSDAQQAFEMKIVSSEFGALLKPPRVL